MLYLDTSAMVKLVRTESETNQLRQVVAAQPLVSCDIAITEIHRTLARYRDVPGHARADALLDVTGLVAVNRALLVRASRLLPAILRSLDALHLAAALLVASELSALVTYDARLAEAARRNGLEVWSPGAA